MSNKKRNGKYEIFSDKIDRRQSIKKQVSNLNVKMELLEKKVPTAEQVPWFMSKCMAIIEKNQGSYLQRWLLLYDQCHKI